uniref:Uncharacterized protein n=1 Tax=Cacopsylla melanoneura TaxID=428564 RepID=A0A8D9BIH3_9HEMI
MERKREFIDLNKTPVDKLCNVAMMKKNRTIGQGTRVHCIATPGRQLFGEGLQDAFLLGLTTLTVNTVDIDIMLYDRKKERKRRFVHGLKKSIPLSAPQAIFLK